MAGTDNVATYGVELEDGVSGPAGVAAGALDKLSQSIAKDTAALSAMQKAMRTLKGTGVHPLTPETAARMDKLKDTIEATRARLAKAQGAWLDMGGTVTRAATKTISFREKMLGLQQQVQHMPGPIGRMVQLFEKFSKTVGGNFIAAGILAMTGAVIALGVATAKLTSSLYSYVTATQNARRTEGIRLEGLTRQWSAVAYTYGLAKMKGGELQAGIDRIAASTSLSREEVGKYGQQLYTMGLRGKQWESALDGMTMKAAVQGDAQAQMFGQWAAGMALTGGSVDKLTERVKSKLGGLAKAQMLDANVQAMKLQENFDSMFRHVDIEPLLKAKAALFSMFSASTASGRYLAGLMGRIVQPLIDAATAALPIVRRFFQTLIIYALKTEIEYLHMRNALEDAFSAETWRKRWEAWRKPLEMIQDLVLSIGTIMLVRSAPMILGALYSITLAAWSAAGGFVAMATAGIGAFVQLALTAWTMLPGLILGMGGLAVEAALVALPFIAIAAAGWVVVRVFRMLRQAWDELDIDTFWKAFKDDWNAVSWSDMGKAIIDGILDGLKNPAKLLEGVKGMAADVIAAFSGTMKIQSPSKVFMRLGAEIPRGTALGIESGKEEVQAAAGNMVQPNLRGTGGEGGSAGGAAGGGATITIGAINVTASDPSSGRSIAQDIKRELETVLEGLAIQLGAPV